MAVPLPSFRRYEVRGILGDGGFATVFRAFDPVLGHEVALKALLPHLARRPELHSRFLAEARAIAPLRHPNIVTFYDVADDDGQPFFTMELVEGPTLAALLFQRRALPLDEVLPILRSLASAIDYLHGAGLVHRDIKTANVMLHTDGRVMLMDFGIVRALDETQHTRTGVSLGTPETMAPEQVRGEYVGPPADVYALGVLAYQLLAGRPPFQGDTAYVLHAQAYDPPPALRNLAGGLPASVYAAIDAALDKQPEQRPPTALAFVTALGYRPTPVPPLAGTPPVPPSAGMTPVPSVMSGAVALALSPTPAAAVDARPATAEVPAQRRRPSRPLTLAVAGALAVLVIMTVLGIVASQSHGGTPKPAVAQSETGTKQGQAGSNRIVATTSARPGDVASVTAIAATPVAALALTPASTATASATNTPSPPMVPLVLSNFTLQNADAWANGAGDLKGCADRSGGTSSDVMRLRLVRASDPTTPVTADAVQPIPRNSSSQCASFAAAGPQQSGDYVLQLFDGSWQPRGQQSFTVARRLAVTNLMLSGADAWGAGSGNLQACVSVSGAEDGEGLRLRVTTAADPSRLVVPDSDLQQLSANAASSCLALAASDQQPAGAYIAKVFDDTWRQQAQATFAVAPPPTAPPVPTAAPAMVATRVPTAVATAVSQPAPQPIAQAQPAPVTQPAPSAPQPQPALVSAPQPTAPSPQHPAVAQPTNTQPLAPHPIPVQNPQTQPQPIPAH